MSSFDCDWVYAINNCYISFSLKFDKNFNKSINIFGWPGKMIFLNGYDKFTAYVILFRFIHILLDYKQVQKNTAEGLVL